MCGRTLPSHHAAPRTPGRFFAPCRQRTKKRPLPDYKAPGLSSNYGTFERDFSVSDGRRFPTNLLHFNSEARTIHPTQKPVKLCEYLIQTYTDPGEMVADTYAGSGTTAIAALNTSRQFICFETHPEIHALAADRIQAAMGP